MSQQVTVLVPTFNRANFLREALTCLRLQTLSKERFRVVILDNASEDNTSSVVAEFTDLDIVYVKRPFNIGGYKNWLSATEYFDTPYFHFLSDDDLLAPYHLETVLRTMESDLDIGVSGSGAQYGRGLWEGELGRGDLRLGDEYINKDHQQILWTPAAWLASHSIASAVSINACLFRTNILKKISPLFEDSVFLVSDRWFMAQIGAITTCITSPWPSCTLRVHGSNVAHGNNSIEQLSHIKRSALLTLELAKTKGVDIIRFWKDYLSENDRNDVKALIFEAYPSNTSGEILGDWQPGYGRLDRLPIGNTMRRKIRSWLH